MPPGLVVVRGGGLGVALEGDGEDQEPPGDAHQLADDLLGLLGVDVLQDVRAPDQVEAVVRIGEVRQHAGLDEAGLEHVGALLLQDGLAELDAPGALSVGAHHANQGAVPGAGVQPLLKGTLLTMSVANLQPQQLWAGYPPLVQVWS